MGTIRGKPNLGLPPLIHHITLILLTYYGDFRAFSLKLIVG